jgi:myo-inositol-1(or 4)-monophosphatase
MSTETRRSLVERAARAGAEEAHSLFHRGVEPENKVDPSAGIVDPGDVVTEADRAAQRRVLEVVEAAYPADTVVGEEADARKTVPDTGIAWVVDPIDGTYNFDRGSRQWLTSVAVLEDGDPFAAANVAPALGDVYRADATGAFRNGEPISVTGHREPRYANVAATFIPTFGSREPYAAGVAELFERFGNVRRYGSAQLTLSHVACGVLDGAVTPDRVNPWDSIAGVHLVERAGGRVTDLDGDRWRHDSRGLVASNGEVHDELLEVARTMAEE